MRHSRPRIAWFPGLLTLLAVLVAANSVPASPERVLISSAPLSGEIEVEYAPDLVGATPSVKLPPGQSREAHPLERDHTRPNAQPSPAKAPAYDAIGGDDVYVCSPTESSRESDLAFADNGDAYLAVQYYDEPAGSEIRVYRSQDGGLSWSLWGRLYDPSPDISYFDASIVVAEGDENRCFVACTKRDDAVWGFKMIVARAELADSSANFIETEAMVDPSVSFNDPSLATDNESFSAFFLYLVVTGFTGAQQEIRFARSTDYGMTWEPAYSIATLAVTDRSYGWPDIAYGFGTMLHVTWTFMASDGVLDSAIRYRSASNYAHGGISDWGSVLGMTSNNNDEDEEFSIVAASPSSDEVVVAYEHIIGAYVQSAGIHGSENKGATWYHQTDTGAEGIGWPYGLEWQPSTSFFIINGSGFASNMIQRASASSLSSWSYPEKFADDWVECDGWDSYPIAINPAQGDRVGAAWFYAYDASADRVHFDAEWFSDPGYPNLEPGFPMPLVSEPKSDPAVADLDGDGDLEIIFSDEAERIQALHHDGTPVSGWPVLPGHLLSSSAVAVGDLDGDGLPEVAAGSFGGTVFAYDGAGNLLDGYPVSTIDTDQVYLCIGALGPPYHQVIVAAAGNHVEYFNYRGVVPAGFNSPATPQVVDVPPALGDVDGDGNNDIVIGGGTWVGAYHPTSPSATFSRDIPSEIVDGASLGDIDLDGEMEVFVPLINGYLYGLDEAGADLPGWPFHTGTFQPLSRAAIAQCLGTSEPEISVAAIDQKVHLLYGTGAEHSSWPQNTGSGWWIYASPIIGRVDGTSSDVVIGARDSKMWSWSNVGSLVDGWPKAAGDKVHFAAAMGDLDLDGNNEVVVLSQSELMIYDLNNPTNGATRTWAMYGHDAQRTGCSDCPNDFATPVFDPDQNIEGITRVSFAHRGANPASGRAMFEFELPERAVVQVDIHDVRGRLVRSVLRSEIAAGQHTVNWDGRDGSGRPVASGQYLARLQARGPRVRETLVRKLTWIR